MPRSPNQGQHDENDAELSELDTDVECKQWNDELVTRSDTKLHERGREPHPVYQAESKRERRAVGHPRGEKILKPHVDEGRGDERLHELRWKSEKSSSWLRTQYTLK